ncbi:HAD family hydrolase [Lignipirellula cremea]|uniref:(S)-2-haloacid dehalogenase 4A n=1 Tax=Lignipirellula cremea TaxID=2528010 RepID=A0A518DR68_9BACT|nr:HAD hydrolase-like protein [Lignipirellula cremea]QDU94340.1 (S)-2-haloacid dehalogenase 4A [Lignipirellula cremea]
MNSQFTIVGHYQFRCRSLGLESALRRCDDALPPDLCGMICDMGDILYDASMWRRWLLQLLQRFGLHTNYRAFYRVWEREFADAVNCGQADYWETLSRFLLSAGLNQALIDELTAAARSRCRDLQANVRPLPGVRSTVASLDNLGMAMVGIANGTETKEQLRERLCDMQLEQYIPAAVSSCDLGCTMPAAEAYQAALAELGLPPEKVAFVGHDAIELAGARSLGMTTIAVNYDLDAQADIYLDRFEQLIDLVARLPLAQAV